MGKLKARRSEGVPPSMGFSTHCTLRFKGKMPSLRQNENFGSGGAGRRVTVMDSS